MYENFTNKKGRIRDPEKIRPGSRGVKKHRIPDPDPQHCLQLHVNGSDNTRKVLKNRLHEFHMLHDNF
jgi:hypothetical protein